MSRIKVSSILTAFIALIALKPCFADPIPIPPPPTHMAFIQFTVPILVNYLWNFVIIGAVLNQFGIRIKSKKFLKFILALTLTGLIIDITTFFLNTSNFFVWVLITGFLLFALSFSLTKPFYRLSRGKCVISGLVYAIASHPIVGITFIVPILARYSLIPLL